MCIPTSPIGSVLKGWPPFASAATSFEASKYETLCSLSPEAHHTLIYEPRCVCILVIAILGMPLRLSICQGSNGLVVLNHAGYHLEQLFFLRYHLSVMLLGRSS